MWMVEGERKKSKYEEFQGEEKPLIIWNSRCELNDQTDDSLSISTSWQLYSSFVNKKKHLNHTALDALVLEFVFVPR